MKVTRYTQSCLLVEDGDTRILLDPSGQEEQNIEKFGKLNAVIYTHEHGDHFSAELAKIFADRGAVLYANESTAKQIDSDKTIVTDGQKFSLKSMTFKAIELPHCLMTDGSKGPQNTGYLINGNLFHPGDGKYLEGLNIDNLALPITGPDVSIKEAFDFAKQLSAKRAIPIHYDYIGTHPEVVASFALNNGMPFEISPLNKGESLEL